MQVQIDSHIPLVTKRIQKRACKWPWRKMKVGQSFFAAGYSAASHPSLPQMTASNAKRLVRGSDWAVRSVTEHGVKGVRVWRVK